MEDPQSERDAFELPEGEDLDLYRKRVHNHERGPLAVWFRLELMAIILPLIAFGILGILTCAGCFGRIQ